MTTARWRKKLKLWSLADAVVVNVVVVDVVVVDVVVVNVVVGCGVAAILENIDGVSFSMTTARWE